MGSVGFGFEFDIGVMAARVRVSECVRVSVCGGGRVGLIGIDWAEQSRADGKGLVAVGERKNIYPPLKRRWREEKE